MAKLSKKQFNERLRAFEKKYVQVCKEVWVNATISDEGDVEPVEDGFTFYEVEQSESLKFGCNWCGEILYSTAEEGNFVEHVKEHINNGDDLLPSPHKRKRDEVND